VLYTRQQEWPLPSRNSIPDHLLPITRLFHFGNSLLDLDLHNPLVNKFIFVGPNSRVPNILRTLASMVHLAQPRRIEVGGLRTRISCLLVTTLKTTLADPWI